MKKYNYITQRDFLKGLRSSKLSAVDFILERELRLFGRTKKQIFLKIKGYIKTMEESINLKKDEKRKTVCLDNIARKLFQPQKLKILGDLEYDILKSAISVSEYNCAMGKIIAAPTAGSCGILPGVIIPLKEHYKLSIDKIIESIIIAGEIGRMIGTKTSIAGAQGGCMAECGVGSAMTAAAVVYLFDPSNVNAYFEAAALALKNNLGLICDPVAGLVEVPCVKRNGMKALEALTAAQLALSGIKSAIPFDEVVEVVKEVAQEIPKKYRETSEGGLAVTPTALKIKKKLR